MLTTSPEGPGTMRATFHLRYGDGSHTVCVVGEFNGWSPAANPMTFNGNGYSADVILPIGRAYRFRYLIDHERWQNDWEADEYAANEFGGDDSVLDLTRARAPMRLPQPDLVEF